MATQCPSCEEKKLKILKLESRILHILDSFRGYKQLMENSAKVYARERQTDRDENAALRKQLLPPNVHNKKGTPGYDAWLTKYRAARA